MNKVNSNLTLEQWPQKTEKNFYSSDMHRMTSIYSYFCQLNIGITDHMFEMFLFLNITMK